MHFLTINNPAGGIISGRKENGGIVMKCSYCGKEAVYELETSSGIINVCEECDEDFTICNVCGLIVDVEEARFLNDADERKTCYECIPISYEKEE